MSSYRELLAKETPAVQAHVAERVEELRREVGLSQLRAELNVSQTELAMAMGIKQPSLAKMEQPDNDPRLSTLKRYVAALGGELSLDVTLPSGKRVGFHI